MQNLGQTAQNGRKKIWEGSRRKWKRSEQQEKEKQRKREKKKREQNARLHKANRVRGPYRTRKTVRCPQHTRARKITPRPRTKDGNLPRTGKEEKKTSEKERGEF